MASGPVDAGIGQSRQLRRYLSIDPETGGLLGVLLGVVGTGGYMLGHKATHVTGEKSVQLAKESPFPWQDDAPSSDYKYKFHKFADPNLEVLPAPGAISTTKVRMNMPKNLAEKISPKFFEEENV